MVDFGQNLLGPAPTAFKKAKTRKGQRYLEKRSPKLVEDAKRALILYGNSVSQTIKDLLADIHKLKKLESVRFSRKNENIQPFEAGGEASLEFYCNKSNCSLFALGSHTKKRPNNLVLGRLYDFHMYDAIELGVDAYKSITAFGAAGTAQVGNKPGMIFVGEKFESVPELRLAKSLLLDSFRGQTVDNLNLAGLDRVMMLVAVSDKKILLRQYNIQLKKSGTKVPRIALTEMGPRLDLTVRRTREPAADLAKEAMKRPKLTRKKEKNVKTDSLDGKIGRVYVPPQDVDSLGLSKPKGLKRDRREAAAARQEAKKSKPGPAAVAAAAAADDDSA